MRENEEPSNVKHHANGVVTYTIKIDYPTIITLNNIPNGWGNGFIMIPIGHPFLNDLKTEYYTYTTHNHNITYCQLNTKYPIDGQEWTYSDIVYDNGIHYYVFGFDTSHYWNNLENSSEEKVINLIEDYVDIVNKDI